MAAMGAVYTLGTIGAAGRDEQVALIRSGHQLTGWLDFADCRGGMAEVLFGQIASSHVSADEPDQDHTGDGRGLRGRPVEVAGRHRAAGCRFSG